MTPPHRGYLTMAVGGRHYLEMAVDMALSLREHTRLPVALATDEALAALVRGAFPRVFDHVTLVPDRFRDGRALKYGSADASPFEETVFVDADCFVLGSLDGLFDVLRTEALTMLGEHLTVEDDRNHHGFSTRTLMKRFGLQVYLKTNSGVFAFRRSAALPLLEECLETYRTEVRPRLRRHALLGRWLGDEITFGIVGGRRGVGVFPEPGPMLWPGEFADMDLDDPARPLLHLIHPLPQAVFDTLLSRAAARRARAGLPRDGLGHLHEEMAKLRRSSGWGAVARRLGLRLALTAALVAGSAGHAAAQGGPDGRLARVDSLYFAGEAEASWNLLQSDEPWSAPASERRWRAIRATVALGMVPGTSAEQNHWLDQGVRLAEKAKDPGPPTVTELFWGAAAAGRRALNAGPQTAGELGTLARNDARLVLAVDSLHGGAHNVIGRAYLEVMSLSRVERILARAAGIPLPEGASWERAEDHLRRATELWPDMVLYHVDLATLLIRRNRGTEARAALERALSTPSLHPPDVYFKDEARVLLAGLTPGGPEP